MDAAINHFIESGATIKAIKAAIECRQFAKAAGIIDVLVSGRAEGGAQERPRVHLRTWRACTYAWKVHAQSICMD